MRRTDAERVRVSGTGKWAACGAVALALSFLVAPAALSYDPEAWLLWGREAVEGRLDVTQGPAIKPLPIAWNALVVALGGSDAAWAVWALLSRVAILLGVVLGAALVRRAARASSHWSWLAGAGAVVATPTLLEGALAGGSEMIVAAALLGACLLGSAGRLAAAAALLTAAASLRPEALVLAGAVGVLWIARGHPTTRGLLGVAALVASVLGAWVSLQWAGGGDLAGGAAAAAALRQGQPGLAPRPGLAALAAAVFVVPWLAAAAATAGWVGWVGRHRDSAPPSAPGPCSDPVLAQFPALAAWPIGLGAVWVATVALMAELGFSGEARYLAPGLALMTVGSIAVVAAASFGELDRAQAPQPGQTEARVPRRRRGPGAAAVIACAIVGVAALQAGAAIRDHRALARSQQDLAALLDRRDVRAGLAGCDDVAVPRFLRPAVAWRLDRSIGSLQSPRLQGAECALRRGARGTREQQGPGGGPRTRRATSGAWSWWR